MSHREVLFLLVCFLIIGFLIWPKESFLYLERKSTESIPSREQQIDRLRRYSFDLLVIGGGATGAGIALDAASRGLSVALVEADDFASGTSSRSTKLIHGGVRYLENALRHLDHGQWNLVRDALQERRTFLEIAPHLTKKLAIVTPIHSWIELLYIWLGLKIYDWVSGTASLGTSHYLSAKKTIEQFPFLKGISVKGAVRYYDGQFNDARMNVALAITAVQEGATIANHVKVLSLTKRKVGGFDVKVEDQLNGDLWHIEAAQVVNATGPFVNSIRRMDDPMAKTMVLPSAGTHLLLDINIGTEGILIPKTSDGRLLFILPWEGGTLAGTTDLQAELTHLPTATEEEVDFILAHLKDHLGLDLSRSNIRAVWSGLRPLVWDPTTDNTAKLSRDHLIVTSDSGLLTIAGGKWTTYRKMAEDVVDRVVAKQHIACGPCRTKRLAVVGATREKHLIAQQLVAKEVPQDIARHLAANYGSEAFRVLKSGAVKRLATAFPFVEAEVLYGIHHEYAVTAVDVLARRTRLAFLDVQAAKQALPRVLQLLAQELKWTKKRIDQEKRQSLKFLKSMSVKSLSRRQS